MNERTPFTSASSENIIQFPSRPSYEERTTAYDELGGLRRDSDPEPEVEPDDLGRTFFDADVRSPDNVWQVEVNRAYDLGLNNVLQPAHLAQLSQKDLQTLATAVYQLRETVDRRPHNLMVEGNYEHPSFASYGFTSQAEANEYALTLFMLGDGLDQQPVVGQLMALQKERYGRRPVPASKLSEARQLQAVVIDANNKVVLVRSEPPAARRLHSVQ